MPDRLVRAEPKGESTARCPIDAAAPGPRLRALAALGTALALLAVTPAAVRAPAHAGQAVAKAAAPPALSPVFAPKSDRELGHSGWEAASGSSPASRRAGDAVGALGREGEPWGAPSGRDAPALPIPVSPPGRDRLAAIFGADHRVPLPVRFKAVEDKIGLLFGLRAHTVCTAFCVDKDIIATAGHCLHRTAGERPPQLGDFWFGRDYDTVRDFARIAGYASGAAAQHVMSGAMSLSIRPPIDAAKDWALVRLTRPVCSKGGLPLSVLSIDDIIKEAEARRVFHVSYHRDFTPWKLAYSRACGVARNFAGADWGAIARDFAEPAALILHTCATGGASSGSPLLLETPTGPVVIGINIGTYVQSKVVMQAGQVTQRLKADTIANTAVSSEVFAGKLETFRQATILGSSAQIRELQTRLAQRGLYAGKVNGVYDTALRTAIEAQERAAGLPVTGLATAALLKRLGR
jgi:protease YdgD